MTQAQSTWQLAKGVTQQILGALAAGVTELGKAPGKRIVVLVSSGFLAGDLEGEMNRITDEAVRANVTISSVDSKGLFAETPGRPFNEPQQGIYMPVSTLFYEIHSLGERLDAEDGAMARFAEGTGGLLFRNNNDLDLGFRQVGLAPEAAYLLSIKAAEDDKYHRLTVKLRNKQSGEIVEARPGYFAPAKTKAGQPAGPSEALDAEVTAADSPTGVPTKVEVQLTRTDNNTRRLAINIRVDITKLPFQSQADPRTEKLNFVAALFDLEGHAVTGKEAEMALALKPDTYSKFSKTGVSGTLTLEIQPGYYRLRTVVQEAEKGQIAAETQNLHIE